MRGVQPIPFVATSSAGDKQTPVARAIGANIGDGIDVSHVDVEGGILAERVFSRFTTSRIVFQLADRISSPRALSETLSGIYSGEEPEVSVGMCSLCVLLLVLLIVLLAASQIGSSL